MAAQAAAVDKPMEEISTTDFILDANTPYSYDETCDLGQQIECPVNLDTQQSQEETFEVWSCGYTLSFQGGSSNLNGGRGSWKNFDNLPSKSANLCTFDEIFQKIF